MASLEADLARREREESVSTDEDARLKTTATENASVSDETLVASLRAELERRVRVVFDKEARAAKQWADEIARLTLIFAEKDSELVASERRCALLASRLEAAVAAKAAAEAFAAKRIEVSKTAETEALASELVALRRELEEARVLERKSAEARIALRRVRRGQKSVRRFRCVARGARGGGARGEASLRGGARRVF